MIEMERSYPSGAWQACALIAGDGMEWLETRTFYGYTKVEAKRLFREWVATNGYKIVRGY